LNRVLRVTLQSVGNLIVEDKLISTKHHDEVVLMYKEHIMRLEFDKEDLKQEIEFYKLRLFPSISPNAGEHRPVFARSSIGRARMQAEELARKRNDRTEKK
jgi:hypothetical protein